MQKPVIEFGDRIPIERQPSSPWMERHPFRAAILLMLGLIAVLVLAKWCGPTDLEAAPELFPPPPPQDEIRATLVILPKSPALVEPETGRVRFEVILRLCDAIAPGSDAHMVWSDRGILHLRCVVEARQRPSA